jgi:purine/pyrimidine-nucleoside phosphorylase
MLKHNTYFEGKVQSVGFERHGQRMTAGVIDSGEYHFDTAAAERMTVVSGELAVRTRQGDPWRFYPAGTTFEVGAKSGFDIKSDGPSAYLCVFLE